MDVVKNLHALSGEINSRASEAEEARRLPKDLALKLAETGAFRLLVPAALGGLEAPPRVMLEAVETAARADSSTGWCVMIGATTGITSAYLDVETAREIYDDPMAMTGGVFAPMGTAVPEGDHYRVNGHWNWASGSTHCNWLMGGCAILKDGKPQLLENGVPASRMMVYPAAEAELPDTWFVVGQSGTGSGDMVVRDLLVPKARSVSLLTDRPVHDGPLYHFPVFGLLALGVSAVALGNARGAMDDFMALAHVKTPQGSSRRLAAKPQTQIEVARAEGALAAARALVMDEVDKAYDGAAREGALSLETRTKLRLAATHATRTAADVTRTLYDLGGGSSVFLSSPLQRRFRDAHVATAHIMVAPATFELTGRALLGLETDATFL